MTATAQVKCTVVKRVLKTKAFENLALILVGKSMGEDISIIVGFWVKNMEAQKLLTPCFGLFMT